MGLLFLATSLAASKSLAQSGGTTATCAQYLTIDTASTPSYYVQTNYWNLDNPTTTPTPPSTCPLPQATQCVSINTTTGDFTVTSGNFECGNTVMSYPSIVYGCQSTGSCSPSTNLPIEVSSLTCVTSSWNISTTNSGYWDAAYDIWFCPNNTELYDHSAELMIWLDYMPGTGPGGTYQTAVTINGQAWNLYEGYNGAWNYIAYLANPTITSFNDENLLAFFQDSVNRGYIQSTWYLSAIEAGIELRAGGVPFSSSGFNANVNTSTCGTPTPSFTATPTNLNGYTSTPTFSPTPSYSPTPSFTPTFSFTPTATNSGGYTSTPSSFTPTFTFTPSFTPTLTYTSTLTFTPTVTSTPTNTFTFTPTPNPNNDIPWPNPWNGSQPISFYHTLSTPADSVALKIFTIAFRKIYENNNLATGAGEPNNWQTTYTLSWNQLGNVANGLYYVVVEERRGGNVKRTIMKLLVLR